MAKQPTQAERIAKIPIEQISKMTNADRKQLEKYVRIMRTGYNRRIQSFKRKGIKSFAQIAMEKTLPSKKPVQLTKLTRNQLILEFARYSSFFNSVTSTEAGIKEVNKQQDIRLFGSDKRGRPLYTMTQSQRDDFWDLYEEYKVQNPSKFTNYGYNKVQEAIAMMVESGNEIGPDNLTNALKRVTKILESENEIVNMEGVPNVYSGRGGNIPE